MRLILASMLLICLQACSAMMVGGTTTSATGLGSDNRTTGQAAADADLAGVVENVLAAEAGLAGETVHVAARGGTVTLSGTVGSFEARDTAVAATRNTKGVNKVNNQIRVNTRQ